jgi:chromosomal replication initiation ATPase DnaA
MTELDPKLTFEAFVVGPANRLASAACRRAADSPGTSYNPLFLYASSGLGKSHLLVAVAHHAARSNAQLRVRYQSLEGFLVDLASALESGERDEFRDSYRDLDILLLDDVQFLAGQPEAQEMLLVTLDALTASGSQIVLASDRPPAEIDGLDARLVSRFSGGLIVDIAAPEFETRVAIIRKKTAEREQELDPGVAEALARYPLRNVRELGGALNRVLAIQDLEGRSVTVADVPGIMGEPPPGGAGPSKAAAKDDFGDFLDAISHTVEEVVEVREEPWRKAFREAADAAERQGFLVRRLRRAAAAASEPEGWRDTVAEFQAHIARLREIDAELDRLDNPWPEAAASVVKDPDRVDEAEALLSSVRERMRPFPRLVEGADLVELEGSVPTLAFKSVLQLVAEDKPSYNPVFVWGEEGRAPRALLAAAGRSFAGRFSGSRAAVTSVSEFAQDFIRALSQGVAGAWRERWWTLDLLLVHGAEALSETERAQDEFFHLFEALKRRGARVLLTADRPPAGIEGIDERLRSRFEGGLVVEAQVTGRLPEDADVIRTRKPGDKPASGWAALTGDDDLWGAAEDGGVAHEAPWELDPAAGAGPTGAGAPGGEADRGGEGEGSADGDRGDEGRSRGEEEESISLPPLSEFDLGDGRGGLFLEHDPARVTGSGEGPGEIGEPHGEAAHPPGGDVSAAPKAGWAPSPERAVWGWPRPEDRLVEELE